MGEATPLCNGLHLCTCTVGTSASILFDLLKYGLMSKYNVMCSSLDPMEELTATPPYPGAGRGHGSFVPPLLPPQTGNPGSITEIECTLLSGSAEQDAFNYNERITPQNLDTVLPKATPIMGVVAK